EWTALWDRCPSAPPFQRPEWLPSWISAYRPQESTAIEIRHEGILVGLAPLLIYTRENQRVLAFMGGGLSDYLDVLAAAGRESLVLEELVHRIHQMSDWDILDLTDLSASAVIARSGLANQLTPHDACSALNLP